MQPFPLLTTTPTPAFPLTNTRLMRCTSVSCRDACSRWDRRWGTLHCSGFRAGNGVQIKTRERGAMTSSHGAIPFQLRKAGKSNFTDLIVENTDAYELHVNSPVIKEYEERVRASSGSAKKPRLSNISLKNVTPEDLVPFHAIIWKLIRCPTSQGALKDRKQGPGPQHGWMSVIIGVAMQGC